MAAGDSLLDDGELARAAHEGCGGQARAAPAAFLSTAMPLNAPTAPEPQAEDRVLLEVDSGDGTEVVGAGTDEFAVPLLEFGRPASVRSRQCVEGGAQSLRNGIDLSHDPSRRN